MTLLPGYVSAVLCLADFEAHSSQLAEQFAPCTALALTKFASQESLTGTSGIYERSEWRGCGAFSGSYAGLPTGISLAALLLGL